MAHVCKSSAYGSSAIDSAGMYSYSSSYCRGGTAGMIAFLVVLIHHVHPYRSFPRSIIFVLPSALGEQVR